MKRALLTADARLDRQSGRRSDDVYLADLRARPSTRQIVFEGLEPRLAKTAADDGRVGVWWASSAEPPTSFDGAATVFLGQDRLTGGGYFASRTRSDLPVEKNADFRSLLSSGALDPFDAAAAALARSLFAWHDTARFCGACGAPNTISDAGWRVRCSGCARDQYPRVDPVVIMLVTDGERCVLAHEPRFPKNMYSCIAGYIEPGEDAAHAVARETAEELGLQVVAVDPIATQPWPFPHSLMYGCIATVQSVDLVLDPSEIEDARWFDRDEIASLLESRHPDGLWIPGPHAIAHRLIAAFATG